MRWLSDAPDPFLGADERLPYGRRLREPRGHRVPVIVVTGFLGAGKSTLVRRLIETPEGEGTAIVVNEIGAIGIDDALLATSGETVRLIAGGCLCCAVRSDLEMTLRGLHRDRTEGRVPPFRRIVLETSGAADPAVILQTLIGNRALADTFHLAAVVTVVDAVHGARTLAEWPEARMQAALADRFVVTKGDLASDVERAATLAALRGVNAEAPLVEALAGAVEPGFVLSEAPLRSAFNAMTVGTAATGPLPPASPSRVFPTWAQIDQSQEHPTLMGEGLGMGGRSERSQPFHQAARAPIPAFPTASGAKEGASSGAVEVSAKAAHGLPIETLSLTLDRPFTTESLTEALGTLSRLRGADMLRAKGLVAVAGCRGPVLVQGVRHQWHPPVELDAWPDADRRSRLVFIGTRLDADAIRRLIEAIIDLSQPESAP